MQASPPLGLAPFKGIDIGDPRVGESRPRFNGAPGQELLVIREDMPREEADDAPAAAE